jgi:hypothetical protein
MEGAWEGEEKIHVGLGGSLGVAPLGWALGSGEALT